MPGLDMPAIPMPIQKESSGKRYIPYGADNRYPDYLLSLYSDCSTLKAIIDGNVNYVMGDELRIADSPMEPIRLTETVREIVRDWYIFGYAFVQVLRNPYGQIVDIIRLPAEYVRTGPSGTARTGRRARRWSTRSSRPSSARTAAS